MIPILLWWINEMERQRREQDGDIYGVDLGPPPVWFAWALLAASFIFLGAVIWSVA